MMNTSNMATSTTGSGNEQEHIPSMNSSVAHTVKNSSCDNNLAEPLQSESDVERELENM